MPDIEFKMKSEGLVNLTNLFKIVFGEHHKAVGYAIRDAVEGERWDAEKYLKDPKTAHLMNWYVKPKPKRIVLFWAENSGNKKDLIPFPFKMDATGAADFVFRWLGEVDYGEEYDTDGHCEKGWIAYNEQYGHVDNDWSAFLAVSPEWLIVGK